MWFRDFLGKFFTTKTDVVVGETLKAAREKEGDIMRELEKIITQGEV